MLGPNLSVLLSNPGKGLRVGQVPSLATIPTSQELG